MPGWGIALAVTVVVLLLIALVVGVVHWVRKKSHGGKACRTDADCPGGTCDVSGNCTTGPPGCRTNADCHPGQLCDVTNHVCTQPQCSEQIPCAGGQVCTNGTCTPGPPQPGCDDAHPCGAGFQCSAGTCVKAGCSSNADCAAGTACNNGTCTNVWPGGGKCPSTAATASTRMGANMYAEADHKGLRGCCMPCADGTWPYALQQKGPDGRGVGTDWMFFCYNAPDTQQGNDTCCAAAAPTAPPGKRCESKTAGTGPSCTKLCKGVSPGS